MNWKNLRENKCPKCNSDFVDSSEFRDGMIFCECGFSIRERRLEEIVQSQVNEGLERKKHNEKDGFYGQQDEFLDS